MFPVLAEMTRKTISEWVIRAVIGALAVEFVSETSDSIKHWNEERKEIKPLG